MGKAEDSGEGHRPAARMDGGMGWLEWAAGGKPFLFMHSVGGGCGRLAAHLGPSEG